MSQVTTRSQARRLGQKKPEEEGVDRSELDKKAASGETVVKGGGGGLTLEAQEHLAAGRKAGGMTRKEQITHEGYTDLGKKGHPVKSDDAVGSEPGDIEPVVSEPVVSEPVVSEPGDSETKPTD